MAAFTGTPVSAATYAVWAAGPRGGDGFLYAPFYWLHTATQGSGTGAINLCGLPPGRWRMKADRSSLDVTALATGASIKLGTRAYTKPPDTTAEDDDACVAATAGKPELSTSSGANKDLTWTAKAYGPAGEAITMTLVNPGAEGALSVAVAGTDITVNLASSAVPALTSTAAQVKAALDADPTVATLITTALKSGQTGVGVMAALVKTALAPAALPATTFAGLSGSDVIVDSAEGVAIFATIAGGNIEAGDIVQGWIAYQPEP